MKHEPEVPWLEPTSIQDALQACGVSATTRQCELLASHADLVLKANESMNLTRITQPSDVVLLHVADSLAFLPHVPMLRGRGVDVGSGAGYPGIPLAIMGFHVDLCESVKKKAAFLHQAAEALGLDAEILPVRAEELAEKRRGAYEFVVCRAVSALPSLVELASPLLTQGGRLLALKGPIEADELSAGASAGLQCGMDLEGCERYELPGDTHRSVVMFRRGGVASTPLPRRPGMAQRQPLA